MATANIYQLNTSAQSDSHKKTAGKNPSNHNKTRPKLFAAFQRLLNQGQQDKKEPLTAETTELVNALTHLQQKPGTTKERAAVIEEAVLKASSDSQLQYLESDSQLQYPEEEVINKITSNTIDIIRLLFKTLQDDKNIPNTMKQLLGQLHIPILKVAILDKSFFSQKEHPARQLLNQLTQAALTWNEVKDPHQDELYLRIHAAIQRILAEFKQNISLFDEISQEFSTFFDREQRVAKALEKRMQQIAMGKEKLEIARRQVMHEINSRIDGQALPPVLDTLLLEGWKDLLLLINMQQGQKSKAWHKSLVLMDDLIWSLEPKQNQNEQEKLLRLMPTLYRQLREGLTCISFDPYRIEQLFKELRTHQIASLHPTHQDNGERHATPTEALSTTRVQAQSNNVEEIVIAGPQFASFNIGTWFKITHDDGSVIRAKMAWRSIVDGSLTLVNHRGVTVLETTASILNHQIQNGAAQILSDLDAPLMDRALRSMASKLKRLEKKQA